MTPESGFYDDFYASAQHSVTSVYSCSTTTVPSQHLLIPCTKMVNISCSLFRNCMFQLHCKKYFRPSIGRRCEVLINYEDSGMLQNHMGDVSTSYSTSSGSASMIHHQPISAYYQQQSTGQSPIAIPNSNAIIADQVYIPLISY